MLPLNTDPLLFFYTEYYSLGAVCLRATRINITQTINTTRERVTVMKHK